MTQILAYGKLFSLAAYEDDPASFGALLSRAKDEQGYALCKCTDPAPKLVIRRKAAPSGHYRHHLATWPNQGAEHDARCRFFVSATEYDAASANRLAAIQEDESGYHIKAGFSMRRLERDNVQPAVKTAGRESRVSDKGDQRDAASLLGVLLHLWKYAGLNTPAQSGTRSWGEVATRLNNAADQGKLGQSPIGNVLYVVPRFHKDFKDQISQDWAAFCARFKRTPNVVPMFLLLGEIKAIEPDIDAVATYLRHHGAPVYMSNDLAAVLAKRYPATEARLNSEGGTNRVIGVFQVDITERGNLWVNDAALMLVSDEYLPVQ